MKSLLLAALLLTPAVAVSAEDVRYYDVELIVFENLSERDRSAERWPTDVSLEPPEEYVELDRPFAGPLPAEYDRRYTFKPLSTGAQRLNSEARMLEKSKRYRVLAHLAWRQPGMAREQALPVHIDIPVPAPVATPSRSGSGETADTGQPISADPGDAPRDYRLQGYVRLVLARYLHFEADLAYRAEPRPDVDSLLETNMLFDATAALDPIYHLQQSRRMRSQQLHYLDNPVLGVAVLVTPFEPDSEGSKTPARR
ncbi:MAG: hypothetical protein JSW10_11140 [Pseudomonadota bacterium]|nr:MAG: hypothetical protein JSW10_11140 [Pseudomonadota bacterium]